MGNESNQRAMIEHKGIQYLIRFLSSDSGEPQRVCLNRQIYQRDKDVSVNKYVGFIFERIFAHNITQIARRLKAAKFIEIIDSQKCIKMFT